jgi:hypothetical protein
MNPGLAQANRKTDEIVEDSLDRALCYRRRHRCRCRETCVSDGGEEYMPTVIEAKHARIASTEHHAIICMMRC